MLYQSCFAVVMTLSMCLVFASCACVSTYNTIVSLQSKGNLEIQKMPERTDQSQYIHQIGAIITFMADFRSLDLNYKASISIILPYKNTPVNKIEL